MKINEMFLEKIEKNADKKKKNSPYKVGLGLNVKNSLGGATVFTNGWAICTVEELQQMIDELTIMRDAIEEETGITF